MSLSNSTCCWCVFAVSLDSLTNFSCTMVLLDIPASMLAWLVSFAMQVTTSVSSLKQAPCYVNLDSACHWSFLAWAPLTVRAKYSSSDRNKLEPFQYKGYFSLADDLVACVLSVSGANQTLLILGSPSDKIANRFLFLYIIWCSSLTWLHYGVVGCGIIHSCLALLVVFVNLFSFLKYSHSTSNLNPGSSYSSSAASFSIWLMPCTLTGLASLVQVVWNYPLSLKNSDLVLRSMSFLYLIPGLYFSLSTSSLPPAGTHNELFFVDFLAAFLLFLLAVPLLLFSS